MTYLYMLIREAKNLITFYKNKANVDVQNTNIFKNYVKNIH